MKRWTQTLILVVSVIGLSASVVSADAPRTTGTITKVTVYRGQALVTRAVNVDLPPGASELIVDNLPAQVVPESIYAQASDAVKVLSVRYREKPVMEDTREEVKQLDAQIEEVKHKLKYAESELAHFNQQWQMFEKLKDFTVTAVQSDLNRGLLTFEPIQGLATFIEQKGLEYHKHKLELEDQIAQLKKRAGIARTQA